MQEFAGFGGIFAKIGFVYLDLARNDLPTFTGNNPLH